MRRAVKQTSELLSKTADESVDPVSENGPFKCDICGRVVRSSRGMLNHLRQDARCREKRSDVIAPAGHPIILEHPGGSTNHLVITLPDSPPLPAQSTTNVPENNMASSNPAPLQGQRSTTNTPENNMAPSYPAPPEGQHSAKLTHFHHGLLESPMPNVLPLNAGDVTLQQGPDSLLHTNACWPGVQGPSAGSEVPAPSQEFITSQLMAVQRAPSPLFQQAPATNVETGFYGSQLPIVPVMQQPSIYMGFEVPLVREPMAPTNQSFPPALESFAPTPQLLQPTPMPHTQGFEVHGEFDRDQADLDMGDQFPRREVMHTFIRGALHGLDLRPLDSAGNFREPFYTPPPFSIPQTPSRCATPVLFFDDVPDDAGDAVPVSPSTVASMSPSAVASMNLNTMVSMDPVPMDPSLVASMNPLGIPPGQLPLPGGPELGSAPAIHIPERSELEMASKAAGAAALERSRMPKPNAPAIMLLIQANTCPTCKKEKPLAGERDMKTHIRCCLPYRTTEGQVLLLRGYNPDLPLAFTIDGQGYKNGIFMCPFCEHRVQVVCGTHPNDSFQADCSTCRSFMRAGIAHLGSHLRRLKDPRLYVPGHHDTCPGPERGCNCIPHYWRV